MARARSRTSQCASPVAGSWGERIGVAGRWQLPLEQPERWPAIGSRQPALPALHTRGHGEGRRHEQQLCPVVKRQALVHLRKAEVVTDRQPQAPGRAVARHELQNNAARAVAVLAWPLAGAPPAPLRPRAAGPSGGPRLPGHAHTLSPGAVNLRAATGERRLRRGTPRSRGFLGACSSWRALSSSAGRWRVPPPPLCPRHAAWKHEAHRLEPPRCPPHPHTQPRHP